MNSITVRELTMRLFRPAVIVAVAAVFTVGSAWTVPVSAKASSDTVVWSNYRATSSQSIEWFEGHFLSALGVGNPKLKVYLVTQQGRIIWLQERNWAGYQHSGIHRVEVNQSLAEEMSSVCTELYEGVVFLDKSCSPIVT